MTQRFRDYFEGDMDALLHALGELATGHLREDSRRRVYRVAPDRAAIIYVLDRLLGRPREEGGAPADLAGLLANLRGDGRGKGS